MMAVVVAIIAGIAFLTGTFLLFAGEWLLSLRRKASENTVAQFEHLGGALLVLSAGMLLAGI